MAFISLIVGLISVPTFAGKKKSETDPHDPYATAEEKTAPPVNAADLAYRAVLFEDFVVPPQWEKDARKLVTAMEEEAITRLNSTGAFTMVAKKESQSPDEPYLVVKSTLTDYRMVSTKARIFAGVAAGTSYLICREEVYDGKTNAVVFQREISTENNAFAAAFSFNDKNLPNYLGNVLADYLALRARKDKGVSIFPLESETPAKGK